MSRRDTIIIAVLINAGLLLILFATAMPSKEEQENQVATELPATFASIQETEATVKDAFPITPRDEVDQVLSEWNIKPGAVASDKSSEKEGKMETLSYIAAAPAIVEDTSATTDVKSSAKTESSSSYTVKKGDSLEKIANKYSTTAKEIADLNQITTKSVLKIGQVLKVPSKKEKGVAAPVEKKAKATTAKADAQFHTVKSGENPSLIASKNNMKLSELLKLNNLTDEKARTLKPGDKLQIK